jgi:hypothetical protein
MLYTVAALFVLSCRTAEQTNGSYPYSPAFVDIRHQLQVFPFDGSAYELPLPSALSYVSFPEDANSVYGLGVPTEERPAGLIHVEFNPIRVSVIQGTAELGMFSVASPLSRPPIVVSGKYKGACGIFLIDRLGQVRMAAQNSNCDYVGSWVRLSLSPSGKREPSGIENHGSK